MFLDAQLKGSASTEVENKLILHCLSQCFPSCRSVRWWEGTMPGPPVLC